MEEKKAFHITITNNETGETLHDCDTNCIIGAFNQGASAACIGAASDVTGEDLANTIVGVEEVVQDFKNDDPILAIAVELLKRSGTRVDEPEEAQPDENEVEP